MLQNASSNSSTSIKLSVAWPCLRFCRWNEPMSGMSPKHGYHPSRTVDHVLTETSYNSDTPAFQRHNRPCHLRSIQYLGDQRYSDTGLCLVAYCEWCNPLLSKYRAIHETIWNYMNVSNLQRRSIPPKICFRNPVVAPIFSFNTIPRMLPLLQNVVKSYVSETCFTSPPITSLHSFLPTERRRQGGNSLEAKTSISKRPKVWPERLWDYTCIICIYIYL